MKIVITDYKDTLDRKLELEVDILKEMLPECEVVLYEYKDTSKSKQELIHILKDADAVKTAFVVMDRELLEPAEHLKCISFGSTGYNNVDLKYAKKRKIDVLTVHEYCTDEVADHTIMLMMALNKNLKRYDELVSIKHHWSYRTGYESHGLKGQTLGLIGFGKIGRAVAERAQIFGLRVMVYSSHLSLEEEQRYHVTRVSMDELCENADIISLHCNLNSDNHHIVNQRFLNQVKKHPILINVGRGGLIDEKALIAAVNNGAVRAVGLDVLESENPDLSKCDLCGRDNVIITPHSAFYSEEALRKLHEISTRNIGYYLTGRKDKVSLIL